MEGGLREVIGYKLILNTLLFVFLSLYIFLMKPMLSVFQ